MAMSLSFRETGSDEANDNVVDICSYCATQDKLQPATHFCFDCGVYGRYICGICERNHKMFLGGHQVIYIGSQTNIQRNQRNNQKEVLELKKKYHEQETHLKQQNEELERRQKHIQELEIELEDLNTKNQRDNQKKVLKLKKKYHEQETNLKQQNDELERRKKHIQKLENELKDLNAKMQMYMTDQNEVLKLKKENREQKIRLQEQKELLETKTKDIQKLKNEVKDIKSFNSVWTINPGNDVKLPKLIVAAIEIGSMFTKVAYSITQKEPLNIAACLWFDSLRNQCDLCVPTAVLLHENKQFYKFGYEAEEKYSDLAYDDLHHKSYFFKRFTMDLNEDKTEITDVSGKKMNTVVVFGAVIKYLKDHLLHYLSTRYGSGSVLVGDIHWVLPVPARWTMFARQIIQQAAYTAGIVGEQLTIVSEPEVSSLYCENCEMAPVEMMKGSNEEWQVNKCPGTKYMVLDLGGYTADITVYERQADGGIKELYKASCESCCGANVDEEFYRLLKGILGDSVFQKFMNENPEEYVFLQHEFENRKRCATPDPNRKITVRIPVALLEIYKDEMGETVKDAIKRSPFSGKITWSGDKMRTDAQIFKNLFKPYTDKIVAHIQDLLKQPDVQGTNIFLMVGGFSDSVMIQDAIKKSFPSGKVFIPDDAILAGVKGAVMYGHHYLKQ